MSKLILMFIGALFVGGIAVSSENVTIGPAKISQTEMRGTIFERPETTETTRGSNTTLDVTTLISSDKKFASGMY